MRTLISLLGLCLSLFTVSFAQEKGYKIGGHFSLGISDLRFFEEEPTGLDMPKNFQPENVSGSHGAGIFLTNQFAKPLAILHGFSFISKSAEREATNWPFQYTEYYSINQIELPVLFKLSAGAGKILFLKAYAGLSLNLITSAYSSRYYRDDTMNKEYGYIDRKLPFHSGLAGIIGTGTDIQIKRGIIQIDLRWSEDITPLGTIRESSYNLNAFSSYLFASFGYSMPINLLSKERK